VLDPAGEAAAGSFDPAAKEASSAGDSAAFGDSLDTAAPRQEGVQPREELAASLRGRPEDQTQLGEALGPPARRLPGFYTSSDSGKVGCLRFVGATKTVAMDSADCVSTGIICTGCFIAVDDGNDKVLNIVDCSTAFYKTGTQIANQDHVFMIEAINMDPTNTLTVNARSTNAAGTLRSSFVLSAGNSAVGYCYAGGTNAIYWPASGVANQADDITLANGKTLDTSAGTLTVANAGIGAIKITGGVFTGSQTYSFAGSTIANLGVVQDADIDGGTIDAATIATTDITVGNSKTLDVSAGTLTLAAGQIAATKIDAGTFNAGATYSFTGSTIASLGQVTSANIDGGTIDGTDITVGNSKTLDVSAGTLTLAAAQIAATKITGGTFTGSQTYSFAGSTISNLGQVDTVNLDGGAIDATIVGAATPAAGTFTTLATNNAAGSKLTLGLAGAVTASGNAGTLNKQQGVITSSTTNLAAGASETITLTNSICASTSAVVLASAGTCTGGVPGVIQTNPLAGSATIVVKNHGASPCSAAYKVYFLVLP